MISKGIEVPTLTELMLNADDVRLARIVFVGSGEMATRCRAFDWAATPLGPVNRWSQSLRTIVSVLLASRHPMFLWWGPHLIQIYNDAYRPSLGSAGRHPQALGMSGPVSWIEIWSIIGPQIDGVMTRGEATWHEDQLVPIERNGRIEPVYWTYGFSPVFDDDGTIGGTLVVCTETTQQVQSVAERDQLIVAERMARADAVAAREQMASVFAQAPVAIAVLDGADFHYTAANPLYQELIGHRNPVGMTLVDMFPELGGSEIERVLRNVFETATPFVANDYLIRFDSQGTGGIDNYYDLVYHPLLAPDGQVGGIVVVAVDVTERRRTLLERARLLNAAEAARADAELASHAKSEFLAVMSHELRTPLNAVAGYVDLMELGIYGAINTEQRGALARIQLSQRHLLGLINGVLNYARVEAAAVHYNMTDVDVGEVLDACETLTAPQMRSRRHSFHLEPGIPGLEVRADAEKLQQIILNLLSNATKFTAPGGQIVVCTAVANGDVLISVTDTGRGIAAAHVARVFDPFIQVDMTLTRANEGVGLGLAISRELARGMGGDLTVESVLDVGSTFCVRMPCTNAELGMGAPPTRPCVARV